MRQHSFGLLISTLLRSLFLIPTSMPTDAKVFVDAVRAEIVGYRSKGYIVLNSAQVVAWPEATDITPELAKKMGVALGE